MGGDDGRREGKGKAPAAQRIGRGFVRAGGLIERQMQTAGRAAGLRPGAAPGALAGDRRAGVRRDLHPR